MSRTGSSWMTLDNSAKIYPAVMSRSWAAVFRVSVTLTETVDPEMLQTALEDTVRRIPSFCLSLHRGLFWYYLDANRLPPRVETDVANPCKKIDKRENGGYCFRVRYYRRRIAVELFHSIADGTGAMIFLKTLAARYLQLRGCPVQAGEGALDCTQEPRPEEWEDSHTRYARFQHLQGRREDKAYHPHMERLPSPSLRVITGILPVERVHERAGAMGVTVNDYLAGVICHAFCRLQQEENNRRQYPVKLSIPVNLRSYYPSETVRNFATFINPGVDPRYGTYSLEETVQQIHHFLRLRLNEKYLNAVVSANVGNETNRAMRMVPLVFKNWAMAFAYHLYGESRYSAAFSNLGIMRVPPSMEPYVERFDFVMGPPRTNLHAAAAVSYGGRLMLTLSSAARQTEAERLIFTELVKQGVPVTVESNQWE
ncbi:MAG: alcohol acetyltransferase [Clostridiales bacterium]|nr:alcohol acetyltransferase [Clostridiales bacterium]